LPVTDDEMYRQLSADYLHHLQWREKLFAGFLVLIGALALAFYHTHKKDQQGELWYLYGWVIPLAGAALSVIFLLLERRCQEVLRDRRLVGRAFEEHAMRVGLFGSVVRVSRQARRITHSGILQFLYLVGAVGFFLVFVVDVGQKLSALWQCLVAALARCAG
jgi:hypothetical protein